MSAQITFEAATGEQSLLVAVGDLLHIGMDVPARVISIEDGKWRFSEKRKVLLVCESIDPEDGVRFESMAFMHPDFPERWPRHWTPTDDAILIERGYPHTVMAGELSGNPGQFVEWPHERICTCGATGADTPCAPAAIRPDVWKTTPDILSHLHGWTTNAPAEVRSADTNESKETS